MKSVCLLLSKLSCLLLLTGVVYGQGVGTSGEIKGTVVDPSNAVVVKATVTAADIAKGIQHSTATDDSGHYQFSGLPPAAYTITVEGQGFAPDARSLTVSLGQPIPQDFHMKPAGVTDQVQVTVEMTGTGSVVDVERASQANTLDQQYINDLPIDRRDYLTFTLLMPGVSQSLNIADTRDLRPNYVPQSGLSFYGSNGRGNVITVDGGNFNGYSQFVIANVSQDAVQEFQINRADYSASLGGASGASINIVTKSGTNTLHGTAYGFFRNDILDARDPFALTQALTPGQPFSLTAKGQPVKNSLSGQQTILSGLTTLPGNPSVPCISNGAAPPPMLPATTCAGILQNVLTLNPASGPFKAFAVNQIESNGGLLPFPISSHQGSVRMDHIFNDTNQASLRYIAALLE